MGWEFYGVGVLWGRGSYGVGVLWGGGPMGLQVLWSRAIKVGGVSSERGRGFDTGRSQMRGRGFGQMGVVSYGGVVQCRRRGQIKGWGSIGGGAMQKKGIEWAGPYEWAGLRQGAGRREKDVVTLGGVV